MAEFTSKSQGNLNTVLGVIGTVGATGLLNNGLGGLFGNGNNGTGENTMVNRYELSQSQKIAQLETQVMLRDANFYSLSELNKVKDYVDGRFSAMEKEICDQKVFNATNIATISCIQGQIAQLMGLTKVVIPNASICPGWGNVTVAPATTTTGA